MRFSLRAVAFLTLVTTAHATVVATLPTVAYAQPKPGPKKDLLQIAQQQFEDQQYEESIQTLSAVLVRPSNTKAQKIEVYRLLALNYITLNRKDEAESSVRGLLSIEPEYELPKSESPRFRDFFTSVKEKWNAEGRPGLVKDTEPAGPPIVMQHSSPSQVEPSTEIPLTARIEDAKKRVASVKLYYRTGSSGKFSELGAAFDKDEGTARANIPPSAVKPPFVEYYLLGFDKADLPIVSRGDAGAPLRVAVPEPNKGWVLPIAIGGGILGAAAIVGGLALAGVFKGSSGSSAGKSTVTISVGEARFRGFSF